MALLAPVYASTTESKPGEPTITYNYDSLSRLTRADYASGGADRDWFRVENLQYDRQGNILTLNRNDEEGTAIDQLNYNYSGTNRLQNVGDAYGSTPSLDWDAEPASFDYDPNGNLTARVENGTASIRFAYDHRNLPLKVTLPDGGSVRFRYTVDGQRYLKEASGEETFYILDGPQTLAVMKDNTLRWWNITGQGIEGRRDAETGSLRYYLKDHLGSTRAVVDNSGTVLETLDYYPFGLLMPKRNMTGAGTMEKFTGKERDEAIDLDYFGARYLDTALGRWLSRDPLASKYPSLSPYNYVANNPVNAFDPDGQDIWFIHGTFSNSGTWGTYTDAISAWENVLNDRVFGRNNTNTLASTGNFRWSGKNSINARSTAAGRLASHIAEAKERNPEMLVQLVGHSHGGNVSIEAANILKQEYGITVDRLVLLGTPNRSDYQLAEGAVTDLTNVYSNKDEVQTHGGHVSSLGISSRYRKDAKI